MTTEVGKSPWEILNDITREVLPKLVKPRFLSEHEIIDDICSRMSDSDIQSWLWTREEDIILGHHSTGREIRNQYWLWHEDNPYTVLNDSMHENFPDQMSTRIMDGVWKRASDMARQRGISVPTKEEVQIHAEIKNRKEREFWTSLRQPTPDA